MAIEIRGTCPWIDRREILSAIETFRLRRTIKPDAADPVIEFIPKKGEQFDNGSPGGATTGGDYQENRIRIFLGGLQEAESPRLSCLQILFHELDHWAWEKEGRAFEYDLPYYERPHEKRAYSKQWQDTEDFLGIHFGRLRKREQN